MKMVLVTGGAGYIGSHTVVQLLMAGENVVILDNLCNSKEIVIDRIEAITNIRPHFVKGDMRNIETLKDVFKQYTITSVFHFAGLKSITQSIQQPLEYYDNNINGLLNLVSVMGQMKVKTLVFSSSATVYGTPDKMPITEGFPRSAKSPYGSSKLMAEDILEDLSKSNQEWKIARLRYFNPIGAHSSGLIGEDPQGIPNNLMPFVTQVATNRIDKLNIYGYDYPTPDGTGIRDYVHVIDLADAHIAALKYINLTGGLYTVNLGTGFGVSVLQMVKTFERMSGRKIPYELTERRPGDLAECRADPSLAAATMGWSAKRSLEEMCKDSWNWQFNNPKGYSL